MKSRTAVLLMSIALITLAGRASHGPSKSEVKRMVSSAHSADDFTRLAVYFDQRSEEFQEKAQRQEKELQRLLALPYHARSYPTQVACTRDLIVHYRTQAHTCAEQANGYREHARELESAPAAPVK